MPLPTCECVKGLPIGEQLAAIYCATYTLAAGDVDGPYLLKSANLSDVDDPDVSRGNINAAESGANTDITSLGGVLDIAAGGATPSAATYPKVKARITTGVLQPLTVGAQVTAVFGTEIQDTDNIYNPATGETTIGADAAGTYTVGVAGLYFLNGTNANILVYITVNGADACQISRINTVTGEQYSVSGCLELLLAAGDVVRIDVYQFGGTAWDMAGNAERSHFFLSRKF